MATVTDADTDTDTDIMGMGTDRDQYVLGGRTGSNMRCEALTWSKV